MFPLILNVLTVAGEIDVSCIIQILQVNVPRSWLPLLCWQVQKIKNQALETREEAQAQSNLIKITSSANYTVTIEQARGLGLTTLYRELNISTQGHKNSFDYLRTLRGLDNVWLTVDFNQRIVGGFGGNWLVCNF